VFTITIYLSDRNSEISYESVSSIYVPESLPKPTPRSGPSPSAVPISERVKVKLLANMWLTYDETSLSKHIP
jgi:hypothetical protein